MLGSREAAREKTGAPRLLLPLVAKRYVQGQARGVKDAAGGPGAAKKRSNQVAMAHSRSLLKGPQGCFHLPFTEHAVLGAAPRPCRIASACSRFA